MPKPTFYPGKPSTEMSRFTNRKEHETLFAHYLNLASGQRRHLPALMFFGVGGVGKSWLQRHLQNQLISVWPAVPAVRIDFTLEGATNRLRDDPSAALADIRKVSKGMCPRFDLAYGFLQWHRGIRDESALDDPTRKGAISVARDVIGVIGHLPVVGLPFSILEKLYPYIKGKIGLDRLEKLARGDCQKLRESDPVDIEKELVWRLAEDLKNEGALPLRMYRAVQAVVFVDTLEVMEPLDAATASLEIRSRWLRDLICELNDRVLFVLAGQNRLTWDRFHQDWADSCWLEQHWVDGLSKRDACEFLTRCGFEDLAVQEAMLAACLKFGNHYHTIHLGLLADLGCLEVNGHPVTAALFSLLPAGDWTALALRFLKSLPDQAAADWICKLALTPEFDETAARGAHSTHGSQKQDTDWCMLQSFSFVISVGDKPGWWSIHSAMQRAITNDLARDPGRLRSMHQWWQQHRQSRTFDSTDVAAPLAWYHRWSVAGDEALQKWKGLAETANSRMDMSFHYQLLSWWQPVHLLEQQNWTARQARAALALGDEYSKASLGNHAENLRQAIAYYQRALEVFKQEAVDREAWASTQGSLGHAWANFPLGNVGENLQEAITCYQRALEVYTREAYPREWAMTQNNLGTVWRKLPGGDRGENLWQAIACYQRALEVRRRDVYPRDWAAAQNNLGLAWRDLPGGDQGKNLRQARTCFQRALQVYKREEYPRDWAETQNNLGTVELDLPGEEQGENLHARNAKACFQSALEVRTRAAYPRDWAQTQNNLGIALRNLAIGDRGENLREAIACFQSALEVRTRAAYPRDWAAAQNNLGNAWRDLPGGDRGDSLREAMACYQRALEVYRREAYPREWAMTQNNLGTVWRDLPGGDRGENLQQAIACFQGALEVFTRETYPQEWAMTQNNLWTALRELAGGDQEDSSEATGRRRLQFLSRREEVEQLVEQLRVSKALRVRSVPHPPATHFLKISERVGTFDFIDLSFNRSI